MTKPGLILVGAGGHSRSCIDLIERHGQYQIVGLVGLPDELYSERLGYEVIATDESFSHYVESIPNALIATGQIESAKLRKHLYNKALEYGFKLPTIISSSAYVSPHASIGAGTVVMHGSIINAGAKVGNNCIINTLALLDHDTTVDDHCHISTGAILNGDVSVAMGSFIGSGCIIKEGLTIGRDCLIGIGLTVRHSTPDFTRFTGYLKA